MDQLAGAKILELTPQIADIDAQLGRIGGIVAPYALMDVAMREQSIGVAHKQLQQLIFRPCQAGEPAPDEHAVVGSVELQLGKPQLNLRELQRQRLRVKAGAAN